MIQKATMRVAWSCLAGNICPGGQRPAKTFLVGGNDADPGVQAGGIDGYDVSAAGVVDEDLGAVGGALLGKVFQDLSRVERGLAGGLEIGLPRFKR